jgi:enamine deaminase RidA (YjgF/YER057c/UK114 family)
MVQAPGQEVMSAPSERLSELGIALPPVPTPAGAYVPARRTGSLVFTAGQVPMVDGKPAALGKLGAEIDVDEGYRLARICALNALAAVDALVGLDAVTGVVKVVGFVASAPGFTGQPAVINGASDVLGEIFGDSGRHARSAVGVAELPLGVPVEVELVVELGAA